MKKRLLKPYMPKGKSSYVKWARRGGLKDTWLVIITAVFSYFYLPIVGYFLCGKEGKGAVLTALALMAFVLVNYSNPVEWWMLLARYVLWLYPVFDIHRLTLIYQDRYRREYYDKYGMYPW